jgi:YidC/Oxa1 family membrane protein insertase
MLVAANIFQPLIDVFESVLKFFHDSVGIQWGWSIVLLTICVRAILMPLTIKQFHSMQKMQRIAPQLKEVQRKYKDDKQRQQQEMMKLYQEHGVNPFASCLPLVLQLPVFISLYYMLRTSLRADICPQSQPGAHMVNGHWVVPAHAHTVACGPHNGANFLFIPDLTNHTTGAVLVVLILLYVSTQLVSSLMMSTPGQDRNQRLILIFMPLVFVFIMIGMPAGVMVYWITTNIWTIGQQYVVRKRLGPMTPITATGDGKGGPPTPPPGGGPPGGGGQDGRNGSDGGGGGGLGSMIRDRLKPAEEREKVTTATPSRTAAPPPPPRKKKKRSGRRR